MNSPQWIIIDCDGSYSNDVYLGKLAGGELARYMLPRMEQAAPGYGEAFWGDLLADDMNLLGIPAQYYRAVCYIIMQACDELESLKPYKEKLKAALEADPRFKQAT